MPPDDIHRTPAHVIRASWLPAQVPLLGLYGHPIPQARDAPGPVIALQDVSMIAHEGPVETVPVVGARMYSRQPIT